MLKRLGFILLFGTCLSICLITCYDKLTEKRANDYLENMVESITFKIEANEEELTRLRTLKERIPEMGHREASIYYRTLTKLYMLRGNSDSALLAFIDAQIQGELAGAHDVNAWLFADISQIYMDFHTYELAETCISSALAYGKKQPMEDFFYEYCYAQLADIQARLGNTQEALSYEEASSKWDRGGEDLPEYQSMELRRKLILAAAAFEEEDYQACGDYLEGVTEAIDAMEEVPADILWVSNIYYPYLECYTRLYLAQKDYEAVLSNIDVMFTAGTVYGKMDNLMNFLSVLIEALPKEESSSMDLELQREIERSIQKIILDYPEAYQHKNITAGTHIYNSNMTTITVFVQREKMAGIYKRAAIGAAGAVLLVASILLFWRKSILKSRIDGLTGAYIRKYYDKVYEDYVKNKIPFGMIMYDIDYFKQINDGFGHEAGDVVLKRIAGTVMELLNSNCKLYRYGGDEFCILCRNMSLEEMARLGEKIRIAVETIDWSYDFRPTLSIGAAHSQSTDKDVKLTVDEKLYESKEAGRNHVSW